MSTPPQPPGHPDGPGGPPAYRLGARDVRAARFNPPMHRRDGYDAAQVRAFLARVADEIDRLQLELATERDTGERIRDQLRRWQSEHAPQPGQDGYGRLPEPTDPPGPPGHPGRDPYADQQPGPRWPPDPPPGPAHR